MDNSFLSREENYKIKLQLKKNHPERIEITEFTRESYNAENPNFVGLAIGGAVLAIFTIILLAVGLIFVFIALLFDLIFF